MNFTSIKNLLLSIEQFSFLLFVIKWLFLCLLVGILAGGASAILLISLEWATTIRETNLWIIALLPLAGLAIGLVYHYYGESVVKGNNQLLEEFHSPRKIIPFRMAPLVLFGTIITHLFGGSAGREGTAVQMGGAIADRFTHIFKLKARDRKTLLVTGVSAGFAAVFGTPLAGAVFAMEVFVSGKIKYDAILPALMSAIIADYTCHVLGVGHTTYVVSFVPDFSMQGMLWAIVAGIIFGVTALVFSKSTHFWSSLFRKNVSYPPLRPVAGGIIIALVVFAMGNTRYIGLGIPTIVEAFGSPVYSYDFVLKIIFTSFTLGSGFKGGEVTPLFFIGATLGNVLAWFIPLPMALLAGMGFVAVFSGATNTPIACTLMGIELFGASCGVFVAIACFTAYLFSGHTGIYSSQVIGGPKHLLFGRYKGRSLSQLE